MPPSPRLARDTAMTAGQLLRPLILGAVISAIIACGNSSPTSPSTPINDTAVIAIEGLAPTVEPITSPDKGWLYRLRYNARETAGKTGATLTTTHIALSTGVMADGDFSGPGILTVPRVPASGIIQVETHLSVLTTAAAAPHLVFTLGYTDDKGHPGSASVAADISPVSP
jgi:hypothetical protein